MQANFKLFLGKQRISQAEPARIKAKNAKSFRMRTHNITDQTKELSARPCNFLSCELPGQLDLNKPQRRYLFDKIGIDSQFPQKEFALDEKRSRNGCDVEHNHFKASFSNRPPLRFLKPQLRYRSDSQSVVGRKNELYRQINNPKVLQQLNCKASLIQYSTEFNESKEKQSKTLKKEQRSKSGKVSLNVLRNKLKQHFRH